MDYRWNITWNQCNKSNTYWVRHVQSCSHIWCRRQKQHMDRKPKVGLYRCCLRRVTGEKLSSHNIQCILETQPIQRDACTSSYVNHIEPGTLLASRAAAHNVQFHYDSVLLLSTIEASTPGLVGHRGWWHLTTHTE